MTGDYSGDCHLAGGPSGDWRDSSCVVVVAGGAGGAVLQ